MKSITQYLEELKVNGLKESSLKSMETKLRFANEWKPLNKWTRDDVNQYILKLKKEEKSESYIEMQKSVIKRFLTYIGREKLVEHLKIKMPNNKLSPKDILTVEEINRMIEVSESHLHKALIAFMFESGGRAGEVVKVMVRDIEETNKGMIIALPNFKTTTEGKPEYRRDLYPFSAGYIRNWIAYGGLGKDDKLFDLNAAYTWEVVKKAGEKAGITKPVTPHKLRHARVQDLIRREYQESIIRHKMGWTRSSNMLGRYSHTADDDLINATASKNGILEDRKPIVTLKQAESLNIANATLQLSKLNEENERLSSIVSVLAAKLNIDISIPVGGKLEKIEPVKVHKVNAEEIGLREATPEEIEKVKKSHHLIPK